MRRRFARGPYTDKHTFKQYHRDRAALKRRTPEDELPLAEIVQEAFKVCPACNGSQLQCTGYQRTPQGWAPIYSKCTECADDPVGEVCRFISTYLPTGACTPQARKVNCAFLLELFHRAYAMQLLEAGCAGSPAQKAVVK